MHARLSRSPQTSGTRGRVSASSSLLTREARIPDGSGPFCFSVAPRGRGHRAATLQAQRRSLTSCRVAAPVLAGSEPRNFCGCSSDGRARPRHGRGRGFESRLPLHFRVCPCATRHARAVGPAKRGCARGRTPCAARGPGRLADHSRLDTAESGIRPCRSDGRAAALQAAGRAFESSPWEPYMSCSSSRPRTPLFQGGDTGSNPVHDASTNGGAAAGMPARAHIPVQRRFDSFPRNQHEVLSAHAQGGNRPQRLGGSGTRNRTHVDRCPRGPRGSPAKGESASPARAFESLTIRQQISGV